MRHLHQTSCLLLTTVALVAWSLSAAADSATGHSLVSLVRRCAPNVAPSTMLALINYESRGQSLAIGVSGDNPKSLHPKTIKAAAALASKLIEAGHSIDMGLTQINSANLDWLNLTTATVFDPCKNIAAGAQVLTDNYNRLRPHYNSDQAALTAALSMYNTGSATQGVANGYVSGVRKESNSYVVPALVEQSTKKQATPLMVEALGQPEGVFSNSTKSPRHTGNIMVFGER